MNRTTAPRSAASIPEQVDAETASYSRTSERAHALGFTLQPTEIEGEPAFLVSRWGLSRVLADLAAVDAFLNRASSGEARP